MPISYKLPRPDRDSDPDSSTTKIEGMLDLTTLSYKPPQPGRYADSAPLTTKDGKIAGMPTLSCNHEGFTLVELLVAMVISLLVSAGAFYAYQGQQNAQLSQKQIVEMQQNIRAATYIMGKEIRMAGYDPYGSSGAGIVSAGTGTAADPLVFTLVADDDGEDNDGDLDEDEVGELKTIRYDLYDNDGDGDTDLCRRVDSGGRNIIAENINSLVFTCLDGDGTPAASEADVRSIQVAMEAAVDVNAIDHTLGSRRSLTNTIKCRNLGL